VSSPREWAVSTPTECPSPCCNLLQLTATNRDSRQHTATSCNATYCNCNTQKLLPARRITPATHRIYQHQTHCNAVHHVQLVATQKIHQQQTHSNTLQHPATPYNTLPHPATPCNTLQHSATLCNTLQHAAKRCNNPGGRRRENGTKDRYQTAPHYITMYHSTTHCNTLQRTAIQCNTLQHTRRAAKRKQHKTSVSNCTTLHHAAPQYTTLQHTATHCNTLQHTATHCNTPGGQRRGGSRWDQYQQRIEPTSRDSEAPPILYVKGETNTPL